MPADDTPTDWIYAADAAEVWYLALTFPDPAHRVFNMRSERRLMGEVDGPCPRPAARRPNHGVQRADEGPAATDEQPPHHRGPGLPCQVHHGVGHGRIPQHGPRTGRASSGGVGAGNEPGFHSVHISAVRFHLSSVDNQCSLQFELDGIGALEF